MFHVERQYARRVRGSRQNSERVTGHATFWTIKCSISASDWNREEFGNKWFRMMVWNRAALHMESGVPKEWARRAYYHRWPAKWARIKGVHR